MTPEQTTDPDLLVDLYAFAASAYADPLDATTIEALRSGALPDPADVADERLAEGLRELAAWLEDVDDADAAAAEVERVHTDLFVGPRPTLQIHESYYAGDFLGTPLAAVNEMLDRFGVRPSADSHEETDHAAIELAALRELTAAEAATPEQKDAFLREHGWWFEALADDVREATDHPLFVALADLTAGTVALDADRRGVRL